MPYFSIIIPLYNKEKYIQKTLESVLNQTFTDFEVIVVDDGSLDESFQKASAFNDDRILLFSKKNEGVSIARNFGIKNSKANYISFLDADDLWDKNFLKTMHSYIRKLPEQCVFSTAKKIGAKNIIYEPAYSIFKTGNYEIVDFFNSSQKECVLWTSCVAINKSVFEKVGVFDIKISKGEDTELWIRIGLEYQIVFIWEALALHVYDPNSISRNSNYYLDDYTFDKYSELEKTNINLKKYLDLNRYSAAQKSKIIGKKKNYKKLVTEIEWRYFSLYKKLLIRLPRFVLSTLLIIKNKLVNLGLFYKTSE
jgi:glycosyltransferase involved in cell wall biosynthesis